jgi:hypothetical protein
LKSIGTPENVTLDSGLQLQQAHAMGIVHVTFI